MGVEQTNDDSVRFRCDWCQRPVEYHPSNPFAAPQESARAAGWRIGPTRDCYCPVCAGTDADYWTRRTLAAAAQAGIEAGLS